MTGLDGIRGQTRAVEILRAALGAGKVHHAYLFEGPEGVGKATLRPRARHGAQLRAAARLRRLRDAATRSPGGNHPDVIAFDMTPKGLTERVRELLATVGFRPHEGRARVVILDPADDLAGPQERAEPANVLLKTLEEPPRGYPLRAGDRAAASRLPVTVRSRCQRIRFLPLEDAVIESLLVDEHGASPADARAAAAQAGGSLGRALAETGAEDARRRRRALGRGAAAGGAQGRPQADLRRRAARPIATGRRGVRHVGQRAARRAAGARAARARAGVAGARPSSRRSFRRSAGRRAPAARSRATDEALLALQRQRGAGAGARASDASPRDRVRAGEPRAIETRAAAGRSGVGWPPGGGGGGRRRRRRGVARAWRRGRRPGAPGRAAGGRR